MRNALLKNTIYPKSCATLQTYKPTLPDYQDRISQVWHKSLMLLIKISWGQFNKTFTCVIHKCSHCFRV